MQSVTSQQLLSVLHHSRKVLTSVLGWMISKLSE
jgi:hypothetical protein